MHKIRKILRANSSNWYGMVWYRRPRGECRAFAQEVIYTIRRPLHMYMSHHKPIPLNVEIDSLFRTQTVLSELKILIMTRIWKPLVWFDRTNVTILAKPMNIWLERKSTSWCDTTWTWRYMKHHQTSKLPSKSSFDHLKKRFMIYFTPEFKRTWKNENLL